MARLMRFLEMMGEYSPLMLAVWAPYFTVGVQRPAEADLDEPEERASRRPLSRVERRLWQDILRPE